MKRPRISTLRRLAGLPTEMEGRIDPAEAAEWEAIVREPFERDEWIEAARSPGSARAAEPLTPASTPRSGVAVPVPNDLSSATARPGPTAGPAPAPPAPPALARRSAAVEHPERRRQAGETAPDFLLRTPNGVSPIADDFFDGLIRRVEGDR